MQRKSNLNWLTLALLASAVGCGPASSPHDTARVAGKITLDGTPLDSGNISFMPEEAGQARPTAVDFKNGEYEISDAPIGKVRVKIFSSKPTGKMAPGSSQPVPEVVDIVPEGYRQGIVVDIAGDNEQLDFALHKSAASP